MRNFLFALSSSLILMVMITGCKKSGDSLTNSNNNSNNGTTNPPASTADVYVSGRQNNKAVYWKNGVAVVLGGGYALGIAVNGPDVYVVGDDLSTPAEKAAQWKNGTLTTFGIGQMLGIQASGTDIYMTGFVLPLAGGAAVSTYWKNGVGTPLGAGAGNAIAVVGTDVYVVGIYGSDAVYWKNGTRTLLTANATANDITSSGTDVYIGGSTSGLALATYWKNGIQAFISPISAICNGIAVVNGDVYLSGIKGASAVLYKNGLPTVLSNLSSTDIATSVTAIASLTASN